MIVDKSQGNQNVLIELLEFPSWTEEYEKKLPIWWFLIGNLSFGCKI